MGRLYADEQFPYGVVEHLRNFGHDVVTVQEAGNANLKIPDDRVLDFAGSNERVVLTLNRKDLALPPTVWKVYNSNTTVGGGVCG